MSNERDARPAAQLAKPRVSPAERADL